MPLLNEVRCHGVNTYSGRGSINRSRGYEVLRICNRLTEINEDKRSVDSIQTTGCVRVGTKVNKLLRLVDSRNQATTSN